MVLFDFSARYLNTGFDGVFDVSLADVVLDFLVFIRDEGFVDDIDSEGGTTRLKEKINLARREYKPALKSNYEKTNNDK